MNDSARDIDAIYAGELALGVLDAEERARAAARVEQDADFAKLVLAWSGRLAPLGGEIGPVEPPAGLRRRVATAVFASEDRKRRARLRAARSFWRFAATAMAALAITAVFALAYFGG